MPLTGTYAASTRKMHRLQALHPVSPQRPHRRSGTRGRRNRPSATSVDAPYWNHKGGPGEQACVSVCPARRLLVDKAPSQTDIAGYDVNLRPRPKRRFPVPPPSRNRIRGNPDRLRGASSTAPPAQRGGSASS